MFAPTSFGPRRLSRRPLRDTYLVSSLQQVKTNGSASSPPSPLTRCHSRGAEPSVARCPLVSGGRKLHAGVSGRLATSERAIVSSVKTGRGRTVDDSLSTNSPETPCAPLEIVDAARAFVVEEIPEDVCSLGVGSGLNFVLRHGQR
ncbi:hypothetical protein R3P38DRAFT_2799638 [Favolaschia claudopus]|uniref:Uncharacterized protein n=1 Tax=Favolaschia claudopus TaxID=2862362 RepID=A0AAW0A062_9AGAR